MTCDVFADRWSALISQTASSSDVEKMAAHADECSACGVRWSQYVEVEEALKAIIEAHPVKPDMAREIAHEAYQDHFGVDIVEASDMSEPTNIPEQTNSPFNDATLPHVSTMLLIALVAALLGYVVGGERNSAPTNALQQLYTMQLMYGGGRQNINDLMLMMDSNGALGGAGGLLPAVTSTVRAACLAVILFWVSRSRLWKRIYPSKLPLGLHAARWLALVAVLLAAAKCASGMYFNVMTATLGPGNSVGADSLAGLVRLSNQLWGLAFWLTTVVLLLVAVDVLFQTRVRPVSGK